MTEPASDRSGADLRLSADIGGTFTDIAVFDDKTGKLSFGKSLSTPQRLVDGINAGVEKAGTKYADAGLFLHGSTVAINTILERTGAKTALITTEGFRDIYEIGRINRPDAYNLFFQKHKPLVERALRFEAKERVLADGEVMIPLNDAEIEALGDKIAGLGMEAVAILFLNCYRNADHEKRAKAIIEQRHPHLFVSASHELSQEYREFERTSTVVANAYIGPRVKRYLGEIEDHLRATGFRGSFLIVQSTGGLYESDQAKIYCVRMLESGPAAGVIGTQYICHALGMENAIAFDMGGTTAKAGVIYKGEALTTGQALLGGYDKALPVQIAMMDIFEVGTGGGSIAKVEDGALRVGPQSAGASPGPACYGLGGENPTVTDANVALGRLSPDRFLGGEMSLDVEAAKQALKVKIGDPFGLDVTKAADGILRIAVTAMSYAVKGVTTERGLDVGDFALFAYGGAGPLHATAIARELGIRKVIIPGAAGVFSAYGMLFSDLRYDYVRTWFTRLDDAPFDKLETIYAELEDEGRAAIANASIRSESVAIKRALDMRYVGQEHAVTVDVPMEIFASGDREQVKRLFDDMHALRYGTNAPEERAEIVSLRTTVTGVMKKPPQENIKAGAAKPEDAAFTGNRQVYFGETGFTDTPTYARAALVAGNRIDGPALVEERESTTVLMPGDTMEVDRLGNLGDLGRRQEVSTMTTATKAADPIVTEIIRNGVIAVTEEMKTNLTRTAYNMIIYEALDFTTGLFTVAGDTVSIGIGLPSFIRGMSNTVKAKIRHFGIDNMKPGDIYVTNDSYTTGSHLNHFTFTMPIFHGGKLSGFASCMAHWIDVGGTLGGITTDIFSEGIQIPIMRYAAEGVVNQDLVDIIRMNVRLPSRAMGDLRAQVTAVKTGELRFQQLLERYGREEVLAAIDAIMDHAHVASRARTATIPDGVYEAESYMDDDGVELGKPVPIRVKVEVRGEEMTIDLTGISDQVRGCYNSGPSTGVGLAQMAYKCITSPTDYPINDGAFRSLKVVVPEGTVVSARRPAPMRMWMTYPMTVVDTVFKALAQAIPDRTIAGHHADLLSAGFHGINPKTREFFIGNFGPLGGGWGAKHNEDGVSATVCSNDGDTHNSANEQVEAKFPVMVERYALLPDSGGAGRYRGGLGVERVVRARSPVVINTQIDRAHCTPWGLEGGGDATGNNVALRIGGKWKEDFPNAKVLVAQIKVDDAYRVRSAGGGGYGPAWERPVETVRHDVRQGYVTAAAAADKYGVMVDPDTFEVDLGATEQRRAMMQVNEEASAE